MQGKLASLSFAGACLLELLVDEQANLTFTNHLPPVPSLSLLSCFCAVMSL
jgi:hypothetical protein